jgi:DNA invertase Pin-like site-specific DNA recombinase
MIALRSVQEGIMGKYIGYIRVSTDKQNLELQKDSLIDAGCYKIFSDVASGAKAARPGLAECLDYLREGDTLVVWKSDRLGRSTVDLLNIVDTLRQRKIGFKSLTEDLFDTTSSNGRLVFGIFALLAEHERDRIRERTMAGLASARARGRKGGRPRALTGEKKALAFEALQNRNKSVKEIAKALGVGEATVYRYQRELKEQGELVWAALK